MTAQDLIKNFNESLCYIYPTCLEDSFIDYSKDILTNKPYGYTTVPGTYKTTKSNTCFLGAVYILQFLNDSSRIVALNDSWGHFTTLIEYNTHLNTHRTSFPITEEVLYGALSEFPNAIEQLIKLSKWINDHNPSLEDIMQHFIDNKDIWSIKYIGKKPWPKNFAKGQNSVSLTEYSAWE